jgi:hypothetical protein
MAEDHWTGQIYSKNKGKPFTPQFTKKLGNLLSLLRAAGTPLGGEIQNNEDKKIEITSLQLLDALEWMDSVMNATRWLNDSDRLQIRLLIRQLEDQHMCTLGR